ncbi:hypothetical protein ACQUQU_14095 [Thalassolituus sp. LLYu03]|uniref:hypothetical protein n=1 Tax=Thalassolituus sp. LLYu03 TaxID=3421656 RepID=UPI003D2D3D02
MHAESSAEDRQPVNNPNTPQAVVNPAANPMSYPRHSLAYFELLTLITLEMRGRFDGNRKSAQLTAA